MSLTSHSEREGPPASGVCVEGFGADTEGWKLGHPLGRPVPCTPSPCRIWREEGRVHLGVSILRDSPPPSLVCAQWPPTPAAEARLGGLVRACLCVRGAGGSLTDGRRSRVGGCAGVPGEAAGEPQQRASTQHLLNARSYVLHQGAPGITPTLQLGNLRHKEAR